MAPILPPSPRTLLPLTVHVDATFSSLRSQLRHLLLWEPFSDFPVKSSVISAMSSFSPARCTLHFFQRPNRYLCYPLSVFVSGLICSYENESSSQAGALLFHTVVSSVLGMECLVYCGWIHNFQKSMNDWMDGRNILVRKYYTVIQVNHFGVLWTRVLLCSSAGSSSPFCTCFLTCEMEIDFSHRNVIKIKCNNLYKSHFTYKTNDNCSVNKRYPCLYFIYKNSL